MEVILTSEHRDITRHTKRNKILVTETTTNIKNITQKVQGERVKFQPLDYKHKFLGNFEKFLKIFDKTSLEKLDF